MRKHNEKEINPLGALSICATPVVGLVWVAGPLLKSLLMCLGGVTTRTTPQFMSKSAK